MEFAKFILFSDDKMPAVFRVSYSDWPKRFERNVAGLDWN